MIVEGIFNVGGKFMEIDKEIIQRYHLGLCNAKETAAVKAWLTLDDVEMTFINDQELQKLEDDSWAQLATRYKLTSVPVNKKPASSSNYFRLTWPIAASIVMILGLTIAYLTYNSNLLNNSPKQKTAQVIYKNIRTKKGQKLQVTLPDGTQVWINSESSMRFPQQFTGSKREVSFNGEAYFRVAKNPHKPFIITSNRTRIQVLGTRFNFRDYANENLSTVVVEEGKVRFSGLNHAEKRVLTANQKGTYGTHANPALFVQMVYNTSKYMDWKDNKLVLDNLTLAEIGPILERWYGIQFEVTDPLLKTRRYTGSFENPGIKQVVESISFALHANCQQQQNKWIITK